MARYRSIMDVVLFNACWFLTAYGVKYDRPSIGPIAICISVLAHLLYSNYALLEGVFIILVALLGFCLDSGLQALGIFRFRGPDFLVFAPIWLFFQWGAFSLLFEHTLSWLKGRPYLASTFALVGGPLSYYAADRMAVLDYGEPFLLTMGISAISWALFFPLLMMISRRIHSPRRWTAIS
jgi:hypothetical protein